jgi:SAM-dependent methyltransferase
LNTEPHLRYFDAMAEKIVRGINPGSVLDVGCALGMLVETLRDRGVEAYGMDISEYAIGQVREDIKPHCRVGSILEPFSRRYDLIICIEVVEHLTPAEGETAVENLCRHSDDIILTSSPSEFREATHFNVQPREYWAGLFAERGFFHDVEYDASFVMPWAMRFRKSDEPIHRLIQPYERQIWRLTQQAQALRGLVLEGREQAAERERLAEQLQMIVEHRDQIEAHRGEIAAQRDQLTAELRRLTDSRGWRLAQKLHRAYERLLAPLSRRKP